MSAASFSTRMANVIGMERPPVMSARRLHNGAIVATRPLVEAPPVGRTGGLNTEDALIAAVAMQGGYARESWVDDKAIPLQGPQAVGSVSLMDLRTKNEVRFLSPINTIHFHFPLSALDTIADANELARGREIHTQLASFTRDAVFAGLAQSLLPCFKAPEYDVPLFVDHAVTAMALHLLTAHCGSRMKQVKHIGGLAPWQQNKIEEMADANPGGLSLDDLASACGLSVRHFTRAFAQSNGVPPYRWLLRRRMERAKDLLRSRSLSLDEIALITGFASQSHFTRVFKTVVKETPAAWQRAMAAMPVFYG